MSANVNDIAREYLRVSKDSSGRARSVTEQHTDNESAAESNGWTLGEPYADNDRSASRYATKVRGDFKRLLEDLETGRFGAGVLIIWEPSRGSRRNSEWAAFLDLLRDQRVKVHVTSHGRTYDPTNARDMRNLQEDGVDSEYESAKISARSTRAHREHAVAGKPTGRTPVGYVRTYDPQTRRFVSQDPDPETAPMIKELFDRIAAGHSLRSIALDFEARGYVNGKGTPYTIQHLRTLARSWAYTGLRVHIPGRTPSTNTNVIHRPDVQLTEATWEPLVSRETFYAVQNILDDPARLVARPARAAHLLSMIAKCDVCDDVLTVRFAASEKRQPSYACRKSAHVRVIESDLDEVAEAVIVGYLAREDLEATIDAKKNPGEDLQTIRDEIATLRRRLDDLADDTSLSERVLSRRAAALEKELNDLIEREKAASTPAVLRGLIEPGKGAELRWKALPLEVKRQVARILLSPDLIGELRVTRSPDSRPCDASDRIIWRRS
ncbi:recombinase family protein [Nocardioides sp. KC13]|uniref:Recombinase family protein n=1 Tax=Nocardioides turkmenicus TaxID=2711220 RepID=A0A6M1QXN2_9ACTN|nr:recombinase family protein [Nocardioides sp. KC13]NGN92654.1 recombinase family protein [Nocardioides sp. KC13]